MKPASLYHHAPGGKRELWDQVVRRAFDRHQLGLTEAAEAAGPTLRAKLQAMAAWLLAQPAVNVTSLVTTDIGSAPKDEAHTTAERVYESIMIPIGRVFLAAQESGEIGGQPLPDLFAGVFVAAVNALAATERAGSLPQPKEQMANQVVSLLLDGVYNYRGN